MLTVILILTAVFIYYLYKQKYGYWQRRGIKGPPSFPIVGSLFSEIGRSGKEIEKHYLKEYGEVFGTFTNGEKVFNTCVPEHIKQIQSDTNTFHHFGITFLNDHYVHQSVFFLNGKRWREHRSAMSHMFTSRKLKSILSHFESASHNFIENIEFLRARDKTDVFEVRKLFKAFAVDNIAKSIFAVDVDSFKADQQNSEFAKLALRVGDVNIWHILLLNILPKFLWKVFHLNIIDVEPLDKLGNLFKKIIKDRDPNAKFNDLVELLRGQIQEGKLDMTEDEIIGNCLGSFFAGTDTTSSALTKCFYFLCTEPEVRKRLTEELRRDFKDGITYEQLMEHQYLDAFVNESLRLGPSILLLDRTVAKDTQLGEYKLEAGTIVHIVTYLNKTSDKFFPTAEKFDINRFLDKSSSNENQINRSEIYLPFGSGARQCLGMRFALLEIKHLITKVLLEYDLFKPEDFKLEEVSGRRFCNPVRMNVGLRKRAK